MLAFLNFLSVAQYTKDLLANSGSWAHLSYSSEETYSSL